MKILWPIMFLTGIAVLAVTFSPLINEPQCTYDQIVRQDGDNCITGANIGAGWLILLGGLMLIVGGIGSIIKSVLSIAKTNRWGKARAWLVIISLICCFFTVGVFISDAIRRTFG